MKWRIPSCLRMLFVLVTILAGTLTARATLDADTKTPYHVHIVLQVGSNRVFTPLFQEQLQRDVHNQLKIAFGDLARVEVTRAHPLLRDIETKGLDEAVEGWDALSERTTHFVLLDYVAGAYQIRTRFHDGITGQSGPLTRTRLINDRAGVAATVAAMIETSFSPVGTVAAVAANGEDVTLKLQGGELGVPMDRWVQRGHVFAMSRIVEAGGKQRAERIDWALLEVLAGPARGECVCRYRNRHPEDTLRKGDRGLLLPTLTRVVKVQLLDDTTLKPLKDVTVQIRRPDDKTKPDVRVTDRHGMATSSEPFDHFAIVEVITGKKTASGSEIRPRIPVALIEGRTVVARVSIQDDRESSAPLEALRDAWLRRAYDNVRLSSERTLELSRQLNQSLEAALESSRKSLPLLEAELKFLDREGDEISRLAKEKNLSYDLREGRQQIDELRRRAKDLQAFVQRLERVINEAAGSEKALGLHQLLERAGLFEKEAEFAQAIRLYEQVVQTSPDQAKVQAHLDQLKQAWTQKGEKHKRARKFVYEVWPTLDIADLQKNLDTAKDALAACREAGDKLTPQKLLRVNVTHTANLQRQLDTFKRRDGEDNRNQAKTLVQLSEGLLRLHNEAATFVGQRKE